MLSSILKAIVLLSLFWTCWRIVCQRWFKTALDNIPGPPSPSFLKGNFPQLFNINGWDFHKDIASKYGGVIKVKALFGENQLYVSDPKALHHVLIKDQYIYEETSAFIEGNRMMLGNGLVATLGDRHRRQRKMLNPVFSNSNLREMIPTIYSVAHRLRISISQQVIDGPQEIDLLSWMTRTALEMVGQCGYGYSFDSLAADATPHPYSVSVKELMPAILRVLFVRSYLLASAVKIGSPKFRRFMVNLLPWKDLHDLRDIVDTMYKTSVEIFESKKRAMMDGDDAVATQIGRGKDILSTLMRANMDASNEDKLDESELIGQVSAFTFAAMDTTSNALCRILHLLTQHQDVQDRLRREVTEAYAERGNLNHDELVALPYLDAVCKETLRLYPPVSFLFRTTRANIVMPLSNSIKGLDGKEINEILIPKNTNVIMSIIEANRHVEIWGPDCLEWIPERWLSPLPSSVTDARIPGIYSHMLTFLGGGRACIGFKFSQLELSSSLKSPAFPLLTIITLIFPTEIVISLLIRSFRFAPTKKEIFWRMSSISTPSVLGGGDKSQLPLQVSRV
ncbi:hypothetical protein K443DRAFT_104277 [Laccaria amethystina LaAM-08-1]|uniref:Cytochrome P450 n=1 Tax=Laccaria amethystina LaAM-08-1 TaxID=1095629 RepID=A0A0C9WZD8_9AGAR|nr:hypothetical protein K443DRAFT_104277 [Laccaria amethystina LaAM-08-1]